MARGVWRNEPAYAEFLSDPRWFHIHDTAFIDYDGYFYHQGRTDDVIITAAGKTGFAEIERALAGHPAVARSRRVIRAADTYGRKKIKGLRLPEAAARARHRPCSRQLRSICCRHWLRICPLPP